ncbi:hypothetical protein [Idiomarina abyssalis]|jgi:uncharacterized membrane protein|uniref:hypothetical protein n=2 Tax=Idiomarinaceae TaxID=267893 RepID=UPI00241C33F5|nr:hypothetical protein [Idiomarina abyssalis]|tara:strand:+ start:7166 stop:7963 length:798 start_codon:yes stop_codon:yes gene_type:complete
MQLASLDLKFEKEFVMGTPRNNMIVNRINSSMNKILWLSLLAILIPLAFYVASFSDGNNWGSTGDFANFGTYMAGTVGPFLALLTIMALLYSNRIQAEEYSHFLRQERQRASKEAVERAKERLESALCEPFGDRDIRYYFNALDFIKKRLRAENRQNPPNNGAAAYAIRRVKLATDNFVSVVTYRLHELDKDFASESLSDVQDYIRSLSELYIIDNGYQDQALFQLEACLEDLNSQSDFSSAAIDVWENQINELKAQLMGIRTEG